MWSTQMMDKQFCPSDVVGACILIVWCGKVIQQVEERADLRCSFQIYLLENGVQADKMFIVSRKLAQFYFCSVRRWQTQRLCLPLGFTLVFCSAYSSTLKMEAICSAETSVYFRRTTSQKIVRFRT
jgi:hypothetical protein